MRAKFVNEITKAEDDWANAQIDKWQESQHYTEGDLEDYVQKVVNHIWKRLRTKFSPGMLKHTNTNKVTIEKMIIGADTPGGFYESVYDYWEDNTPWEEAANSLFDECYRYITAQGQAM